MKIQERDTPLIAATGEVKTFIAEQLSCTRPRDDYLELLRLSALISCRS